MGERGERGRVGGEEVEGGRGIGRRKRGERERGKKDRWGEGRKMMMGRRRDKSNKDKERREKR